MKKNKAHYKETAILAAGEILVSGITVLGFFISNLIFETGFTYRIFTGAALGMLVAVLNFFALSCSVNRQIDKYIALRGTEELSEEEAMKFTLEHSMKIQNAIRTSFIVRMVTMLAALVVAFVLDWFAPLATAIPIFAYRPILMAGELIRKKFNKIPNPANFIKYDEDGFSELPADGEAESAPEAAEENGKSDIKESDE